MAKPKKYEHPKWLKRLIWTAQTKFFPYFFSAFLAVWAGCMTFITFKSLSIFVCLEVGFLMVLVLGILVMHEANFKPWKKWVCIGVGISPMILFGCLQFVPPAKTKIAIAETKSVIAPQEKDFGLLRNGGFEDGLANWVSNEYAVKTLYVSSDVVTTMGKAPVMSLIDGAGLGASKGLLINCDTKPGPNEYKYFAQKIGGLKSNAKYKVNFFLYRGEHAEFNEDSIYMLFDGNWPLHLEPPGEGRILKRKIENGWTKYSINLVNDASAESAFLIVVNDRAKDIRLDDISIELSD